MYDMYVSAPVSQMSACKNFLRPMFFCARNFALTIKPFWRAEQVEWVENFTEMRKVDQCSDEMKTVEKNLFGLHVRRDGTRWKEVRWLRWDDSSSAKCKCEVQVWSVKMQSEVWGHVLGQHLRNSFAQSTHARTWLAHGACKFSKWNWEVIHESFDDILEGMRWDENRREVRRIQMRCSVGCEDVWSVKSAVWNLGHEECSVQSEVWSVEWSAKCGVEKTMKNVKCGLWSPTCEVWSVKCGVLRAHCEMKFGARRVQWELWSAKWSFKFDMWNKTPLSQNARTHGPDWPTAHASSIGEKGLIYPQGTFRPASCW